MVEGERERDGEKGGLIERMKRFTLVIEFEASQSLRTGAVCHFGIFFFSDVLLPRWDFSELKSFH